MGLIGHWISIECFKHDGSLHRWWDRGFVVDDTEDYLVVATKRAKVTEYNGRSWFTQEPAVTIFSKNEWWNAICMLKDFGIVYYCNIASPSVVEKDVVKYIDYDLDAKLFPNDDIRVLDEKEYKHHLKKYKYGDDLNCVLRYQMDEIQKLMKKRIFPFDDNAITYYYDEFLKTIKKN